MENVLRFRRSIFVVLSSALVLAAGVAGAAEHLPDTRGSRSIAVIDPGLVSPEAVTIGHGEAVEFANLSSQAIQLVFVEPKDRTDEVRCQFKGKAGATPEGSLAVGWPSFGSAPISQLTVTIPPGHNTTACSFAPGRYGFVTRRVGRDPRSPVDALGQKGTITVE